MSTIIQRSFSAGEMTPSLYYRVDLARYAIGLRTLRNAYVLKQGGAENRPGTQFLGEVKTSSLQTKLIPFVLSSSQSYVLEFGNLYMRVYKDGAQVKESAKNITAITAANPAVVTSNSHGYADGDEVYISGISGMTELNGRNCLVANKTTNTFELTDLGGTNIDSSAYTAYSSGGTAEKIYELTTTFSTATALALKYEQVGSSVYLNVTSVLTRSSDTSWAIATLPTSDLLTTDVVPSLSIPAGSVCEYYALESDVNGNFQKLGFSDTGNAAPTTGAPITITLTGDSDAVEFRLYRADNVTGKLYQAGVFGLVGVTVPSSGSATIIDDGSTIDYSESFADLNKFTAQANAFAIYQNRLVTAGNSSIVASAIGNFSNFHVLQSQTVDSSPFQFSGIGGGTAEIKHIIDFNKLVILTDSGEFVAFGNDAGIITPSAINIRRQSSIGSHSTRPLIVDSTLFFVQAGGSIVRAFGYNIADDGYQGSDTTMYSSHLFRGYTIDYWAFQRNPHNILWAVRSDGTLLGFTYDKENQMAAWHRHDFQDGVVEDVCVVKESNKDRVYLLVKRTIDGRTVRYVERMADRYPTLVADYKFIDSYLSYDGRNGNSSHTMTLSGGSTWAYDETITLTSSTSYFSSTDVGNEIHLTGSDGELIRFSIATYSSATVVTGTPNKTVPASLQATATSDWSKAVDQVSGLWHLEGETISIFADGFVVANPNNDSYDSVTVSDGTISLDKCYSVIHAGLPYLSDIETLDIDTTQAETLIDKNKLSNHVTLGVENTRGIWGGARPPTSDTTDPKEGLTEFKLRSNLDSYDAPPALKSETVDLVIQGDYNSHGRVFLRQLDPVPMTILAIAPSGVFPFRG